MMKNSTLNWEERNPAGGVAQKYGYISKMIFRRFNGHEQGYKPTEI
jgi:hypothetical protein